MTLRWRYFIRLALLVGVYFVVHTFLLFLFNRHEIHEGGHNEAEEFQEFLIIAGIGAAMLPALLILAWTLSGRMLKPLRAMADTARSIGDGLLTERLRVGEGQDEISSLALTINQAFDRYQEAVDRMHRFSANVSHQLRNPLTALRGTGEVTLQRDRTPEVYRNSIGEMLEEVQRLSGIVDQLLLMARMDAAALRAHFEPCDVAGEIAVVTETLLALAQERGISISSGAAPGLTVRADPALLRQAIENLLDNAIRHTPDGGRVGIAAGRHNGQISITVSDGGPGIPEEMRGHLFERFRRGGKSGYDGIGIGLAIAAEVMKAHGGSIEVDAAPGGGSAFTLRLPA